MELLCLPLEILYHIGLNLDICSAVSFLKTCRTIYNLLDLIFFSHLTNTKNKNWVHFFKNNRAKICKLKIFSISGNKLITFDSKMIEKTNTYYCNLCTIRSPKLSFKLVNSCIYWPVVWGLMENETNMNYINMWLFTEINPKGMPITDYRMFLYLQIESNEPKKFLLNNYFDADTNIRKDEFIRLKMDFETNKLIIKVSNDKIITETIDFKNKKLHFYIKISNGLAIL